MFGYVNVNSPKLTKAERERFSGLYCGVCEELRRVCGARGRFALSYDCAFLALVLCSLYEPEEQKRRIFCGVHPVVKHSCHTSEVTAYAADINVLLAYYSCLDNWQDEGSRLGKTGADLLRKAFETCAGRRKEKVQFIEQELSRLSALEKQHCTYIDTLSGCFGRLLGELFVYKTDSWADRLRRAGDPEFRRHLRLLRG